MRTTVITSRHRASLYLLPAAGRALDLAAFRAVLDRHGLELVEGADLARAHELIAAEGLDPVSANELAEALRAEGLHARVVNGTSLVASDRIEGAFAAQFVFAFAGFMAVLGGLEAAPPALGWVLGAVGVALLLLAVFNGFVLARGGTGLRIAGVVRASIPRRLALELAQLAEMLPEHLAAALLARARKVEAHALREPTGEAARELDALVEELRESADRGLAEEARALREEVGRARRAAQETRGGS